MSDGKAGFTRTRGTPAASEYVLRLVHHALDEFDSVPLEASLRRTVRIANLLGETLVALRLAYELKPSGGHPPANSEMTRRLMADPGTYRDPDGLAEKALSEYMAERRRGDQDLILTYSIAEIEFWQEERFSPKHVSEQDFARDLGDQAQMVSVVARARHQAFTLLCQWERRLTFAQNQGDALFAAASRVDALLSVRAPDVLDQFNVAFRRLREAAGRDAETEAAEELSHALTSCRRILKAVVDSIHPADPSHLETDDGHKLADEQYKNRLFEFLKTEVDSQSFQVALTKSGEALFDRFGVIDGLSSKGVHARVALDEAHFCALSTYTLAGEILALVEKAKTVPTVPDER